MREERKKQLDIIVPCYNEEGCIEPLFRKVDEVMGRLPGYSYSLYFIDDGSRDQTVLKVKRLRELEGEKKIKYISFSRNFGKEAAIYAGLTYSTGDYTVVMDSDLQHPPELLIPMTEAMEEGYDCCAMQRKSRTGDPAFRSLCASLFYRLMNRLSDVRLPPNDTDYRMMTRQVVEALLSMGEVERFSKGLFSWVGYRTKYLTYEYGKRVTGNTKWSFGKLFLYAVDGIVAFTTAPLRLASGVGLLVTLAALGYAFYMFISALINERAVPGYASLLILLLFLGGMILSFLGVLGEYLARIYNEVKKRPIFLIRESNVGESSHPACADPGGVSGGKEEEGCGQTGIHYHPGTGNQ